MGSTLSESTGPGFARAVFNLPTTACYIYGARVLAPCAGELVSAIDGLHRTSNVPKPTSKITAPVARTRKGRSARGNTVSVPYEDTLIESLRDPEEVAACLEAALEDGDQAVLMLALRQVAQARGGVAPVARKATLTREATYRACCPKEAIPRWAV
jgi:probable addiction module antidote protein